MDVSDLALIVSLHIAAGPARTGLEQLIQQANVELVWGDIETAHTRAVDGRYSVFDGLCALLAGSGLTFHAAALGTITVFHQPPGEPDVQCQDTANGFGPDFIEPPVADWK